MAVPPVVVAAVLVVVGAVVGGTCVAQEDVRVGEGSARTAPRVVPATDEKVLKVCVCVCVCVFVCSGNAAGKGVAAEGRAVT